MNSIHSAFSREENEILQTDSHVIFQVCLVMLQKYAPRKKKKLR